MTQAQCVQAAQAALASGNYMLRRSDGGLSNCGQFRWQPVGEWTEAPDWNPQPVCGGGLHGNHPDKGWAYWTEGKDLDFCEIDPAAGLAMMDDKIKVKRARVLLRDDLSALKGLRVRGDLNLNGCIRLTSLPDSLTVGGKLRLGGCTGLTSLPDSLTVGADLGLCSCSGLTSLPDGLTVGGYLYLYACSSLTSLPNGLTVGGNLYLYACPSLTSLPGDLTVKGDLDLYACSSLTALPDGLTVGGKIYTQGCSPTLHADMAARKIV